MVEIDFITEKQNLFQSRRRDGLFGNAMEKGEVAKNPTPERKSILDPLDQKDWITVRITRLPGKASQNAVRSLVKPGSHIIVLGLRW